MQSFCGTLRFCHRWWTGQDQPLPTQCVFDNSTDACGAGDAKCILAGSVPGCDSCLPCGGEHWLHHKGVPQLKDQPAANPCATLPCVHPGVPKNSHGDYRLVMGCACAWLLWTVVFWTVAYRMLKRKTTASTAGDAQVGNIQESSRERLLAAEH